MPAQRSPRRKRPSSPSWPNSSTSWRASARPTCSSSAAAERACRVLPWSRALRKRAYGWPCAVNGTHVRIPAMAKPPRCQAGDRGSSRKIGVAQSAISTDGTRSDGLPGWSSTAFSTTASARSSSSTRPGRRPSGNSPRSGRARLGREARDRSRGLLGCRAGRHAGRAVEPTDELISGNRVRVEASP